MTDPERGFDARGDKSKGADWLSKVAREIYDRLTIEDQIKADEGSFFVVTSPSWPLFDKKDIEGNWADYYFDPASPEPGVDKFIRGKLIGDDLPVCIGTLLEVDGANERIYMLSTDGQFRVALTRYVTEVEMASSVDVDQFFPPIGRQSSIN